MTSGTTITATVSGGTLDAATLDGNLEIPQTLSRNTTATILGGLVLNGTIQWIGITGDSADAVLDFGNFDDNTPQTVSGSGTMQFGQSYGDLDNNSNDTLTVGSGITVRAGQYSSLGGEGPIDFQGTIHDADPGGQLTIRAPGWTNEGTITATAATLYLDSNWTNSGTIGVDAASTIGLGDVGSVNPTMDVSGYNWTNKGAITIANGATVYLGGVFTTDTYDGNLSSLGVSANLAQDTVYLTGTVPISGGATGPTPSRREPPR